MAPMPKQKHASQSHGADDDDSFSGQSYSSASQSGYSFNDSQAGESTMDGTVSSGSCSLDSFGEMLLRLEDNDESLSTLAIDCTLTSAARAKYVAQFLPGNTHLKKLRLTCGNKTSHRSTFRKVISGLKDKSSVEYIEIQDAVLNRDSSTWLIPLFSRSKSLNQISMVNCIFVGSGLSILLVALQHNKHLRHLNFHSCDWDEHNSETIAASLPFLNLHSLSLVDINIDVDAWPYLFENIERLKNLIVLDLSRNKVDDDFIRLLAKSLTIQKSVSTLALSSCGLDDQCAKELAKGLRKYSPLTKLDLSRNVQLSDKGVVYLKDLIKFNQSISELKVDGCGLNNRSLNSIESGLRYNNSFLKSFFSESTSQAIFGVVDSIEKIDIGESTRTIVEAVSFGSGSSPSKEERDDSTKSRIKRIQRGQKSLRRPGDSGGKVPPTPGKGNSAKEIAKFTRSPETRKVLL
jgi:Ran GTPase-activating protein (RanGAP) involved in mRNA processing and transport